MPDPRNLGDDFSQFVVHFTKPDDEMGYRVKMRILSSRVLLSGPDSFGAARLVDGLGESQRCVCFSEIPPGFLHRLADRRGSRYGIGFRKRFIIDSGGAPIWYVEDGTQQHASIGAMIAAATRDGQADPNEPIWSLTPFIDLPSGPDSAYRYDFRWEREWRVASDLEFEVSDVAFLVLPEELHGDARAFFQNAADENFGPSYTSCAYIDPFWPVERAQTALRAAAEGNRF
jgi:hypothetical protein